MTQYVIKNYHFLYTNIQSIYMANIKIYFDVETFYTWWAKKRTIFKTV